MKRLRSSARTLVSMLIVAGGAQTVSADWHEFWHDLHIGFHRNNAWPDPFNEADAMQVVAPFEIMKHNGWRVHNTIGHELFREGDGALLAAGHNRVQWIATQSPSPRRQIYVLRGRDEQETESRVDAVKRAVASMRTGGPETEVFITDVEPTTAPGAWATKVNRDMLDQMPLPKLPSNSASGASGAATSSSGSNVSR